MRTSRNWLLAGMSLLLPLAMMACDGGGGGQGGAGGATGGGGAGGTGAQGGSGGSGGSSGVGGAGGTGGAAMSLAADGTIQDDCAPNDGPAIALHVGTASACGMPGDDAPQARFLAYPGSVDMLAAGDKWTATAGSIGQMTVSWYPGGAMGAVEGTKTGELEVISATATMVEVKYSFETMNGEKYAGTAVLDACDSTPLCG